MAQILVVQESAWYQGIAALKNYYESELEIRIHKHAVDAFSGYYTIKGKFTFNNAAGETSDGDLLLISRDFSKWLIVEVELIGKSLTHTKKQLRVFTGAKYDIGMLIEYCVKQDSTLDKFRSELAKVFLDPPDVLVIFDSYKQSTIDKIRKGFNSVKICVFEIYKTNSHDFETYRLSGDYPYITSGFSYLKPTSGFEVYEVHRADLMNGVPRGKIELLYQMGQYRCLLIEDSGNLYIKIPNNPFTAGRDLTLSKTHDGKFVLDTLN
jgi:hypothetical protein